ncbi:MAG: hypothetical protein LBL91_05940 [Lachnospiraceae bacterium]|jgi:phage antirepressor YoqD-like protein|nr:hypothetical protein [Lachnospiraceae bacterium]
MEKINNKIIVLSVATLKLGAVHIIYDTEAETNFFIWDEVKKLFEVEKKIFSDNNKFFDLKFMEIPINDKPKKVGVIDSDDFDYCVKQSRIHESITFYDALLEVINARKELIKVKRDYESCQKNSEAQDLELRYYKGIIKDVEDKVSTYDAIFGNTKFLYFSRALSMLKTKTTRPEMLKILRGTKMFNGHNEPNTELIDNGSFKIIETKVRFQDKAVTTNKVMVGAKGIDLMEELLELRAKGKK